MNWYGVKLLCRHIIEGDSGQFYEESVMLVRAASSDEAYERAEKRAAEWRERYENIQGRTVRRTVYDWLDCFLIGGELEEGTELYSSIFRVHDPEELRARYRYSSAEDPRPLRHR